MEPNGRVEPGWEPVREAFVDNFRRRGEVGAAVVVRHRGRVVVDLWGGLADPRTGRAWEQDTPGVVFSATKGLVAMVLLQLLEEGAYDLDAPASAIWPELTGEGRERITPRMLLSHRSGLSAIDQPLTLEDFRGPSPIVAEAMARQVPQWEPGTDQGYAMCTYGIYTAELVRRLTGRSLGQEFATRIAGPLGLDAWIGLPEAAFPRVARLLPVRRRTTLVRHLPSLLRNTTEGRLLRSVVRSRRSDTARALLNPTLGPTRFEVLNQPEVLALELPWMNGVATAAALSKAYAALIGDIDGTRLVRPESLRPLRARQSWSPRDRVLHKALGWSQGFLKEEDGVFSANPAAFGHAGAGGALGWVDPDAQIAIGYVMNQMDWRIRSPRALALAAAIRRCG